MNATMDGILVAGVTGLATGLLASIIIQDTVFLNIITGTLGAFVAGHVSRAMGAPMMGEVIAATTGAIVLILLIRPVLRD